ncbi:ATP-binding protein [Peptococcaceae bacterium 1198_IL3148]
MDSYNGLDTVNYINQLTVYRDLLNDDVLQAMLAFINSINKNNAQPQYGQLFFILSTAMENDDHYVNDGWQNHLLNLIIMANNPFTRQAATYGVNISPSLRNAAIQDLRFLQSLFNLNAQKICKNLINIPLWDNLYHVGKLSKQNFSASNTASALINAADWGDCVDLLINHYHRAGVGIFGRFHTLLWDGEKQNVIGVNNPDPIKLSDLIGYDWERKQIVDNTEAFIKGYPANNVLLYGDRGTGKSSTVKALVNSYGTDGLRLIEVPKQYLADFPVIIRLLSTLHQYFILFVDDLSFEDFEVEYKALKAVLEGGVETKPKNVLIYATSNRRHLIRESHSERQQDDVHAGDTMQEKLSLSDRFGLTVTFISPNQQQYLAIVEGLATGRGLNIPKEELHRQAIQWELRHSGRSGRVARQFVDYLEGTLK